MRTAIGETLVGLAELRGLAVQDLAQVAGISRSQLHRCLTERGWPALGLLRALPAWMEALGVDDPEARAALILGALQTVLADDCEHLLDEVLGLLSLGTTYREALWQDLARTRAAIRNHQQRARSDLDRLGDETGVADGRPAP